jgi:hypothetical protein
MRGVFGSFPQIWGRKLSQAQRDLWNEEGPKVWSHPRCGTRGKLIGEQLFTGLNSVLGCVGLPPVWEPPVRAVFNLSVVRELVITNGEDGVRLFLRLAGPPAEDVMVFGQEPCSAGRSKRRNVSYVGLLPAGEDGVSEITELYKVKYGEPRAGTKVFIVTCQQKNGWKGLEQETSGIVPGRPEGEQAVAETADSDKPLMHKGCTRDEQGTATSVGGASPGGSEGGEEAGKAVKTGLEGRLVADGKSDAPV